MDTSTEQLEKQYGALPEEIQEILSSVEIADEIQDLGDAYGLRVDQLNTVVQEATRVLLGMAHPNNLESNIQKALSVPLDKATLRSVVEEIDRDIFGPVRNSILQTHRKSSHEERSEETGNNLPPAAIITPQQTPANPQPAPSAQPLPQKIAHQPNPAPDIAKEKMESAFRLPQTQVGYKGVDPYREPTK